MHRMVVRFALVASVLLPAPAAAQGQPPACPFTTAELSAALGDTFAGGTAGPERTAFGATMRSCRYDGKRISLVVNSTVYGDPAQATTSFKYMAGKLTPVPGDADGAMVQTGQGDMTSPAVHYLRGPLQVELRVLGLYYTDPKQRDAALKDMQDRLLKLRRH